MVVALGVGSIGEVLLIEQGAVAGIVDDVEVELLRDHVARRCVQVRRPGEGDVPLVLLAGVLRARSLERDAEHGHSRGIRRIVVGEQAISVSRAPIFKSPVGDKEKHVVDRVLLIGCCHVELMFQADDSATIVIHVIIFSVFQGNPNVDSSLTSDKVFGAVLLIETVKRRITKYSGISACPALGNEVETRNRAAGFVQGTRLSDTISLAVVFSLSKQYNFFYVA